uniref:Uncharacterized protein n=1 Tax=uncultured marine thaumarchaeote SAT1000_12_G12 TaxID=1456380 RepID=A0A075I359_9ARCH|nr:hypothetical protein [uncultured marine thaumarchaeote SAT1000_12_G12]
MRKLNTIWGYSFYCLDQKIFWKIHCGGSRNYRTIYEKYNVNPNQLVKRSVFLAIGYTEYENLALTDPKFRKIFETIIDESQKIMSNPRILKRIEKKMAAEKISQEALDNLESNASDIDKDVKTLRKRRSQDRKKLRRNVEDQKRGEGEI